MTNMKKRVFGIVMSSLMILSTLAMTAGASYDNNTHYKNLNNPYDSSASPTGMSIYFRYSPNNARAHTSVHVRPQNTEGKAYAALMQRDASSGANAGFRENSSYYIKTNGHIDTTVYGFTPIANYVLHSGYSRGHNNWRYDIKNIHRA